MAIAVGAMSQQVVCHRGHWRAEGSAQNSLRSLVKADSIGAWGSEFDVWMSADGVLFVNHDATINGVEIARERSEKISLQRLSNGEPIPTLESMLDLATGLKIHLVVELKPHRLPDGTQDIERERKAVEAILAMVHDKGLESRVSYISFSAFATKLLARTAPAGTPVYYLDGKRQSDGTIGIDHDMTPSHLWLAGVTGVDYQLKALVNRPELLDECRDLGMPVNVWTVDKPEGIQWCIDHGLDYITTNEPELTMRMIRDKQLK